MLACIEELGDPDDESIGHVMFEELENNRPKEKEEDLTQFYFTNIKRSFIETIIS